MYVMLLHVHHVMYHSIAGDFGGFVIIIIILYTQNLPQINLPLPKLPANIIIV